MAAPASKTFDPFKEPLCYLFFVRDLLLAALVGLMVFLFLLKSPPSGNVLLFYILIVFPAALALWILFNALRDAYSCRHLSRVSVMKGELFYDNRKVEGLLVPIKRRGYGRPQLMTAEGIVELNGAFLPIVCRHLSPKEVKRLELPYCPSHTTVLLSTIFVTLLLLAVLSTFAMPLFGALA